jgi:hypothetical protein
MPTYSIDGPDGKTYSIEGPEGATREQVIAKIKEKQAAPLQEQPSAVGDFVKSVPTGMARTAADFARGEQLESEQRAMAFTDKPDAGPKIPTGDEVAPALGLHQPEGRAGRFGQTLGEFAANPASYLGPGSAVLKVGGMAASALASEGAGQLTEGTKAEPIARIVGGAAGGGAAGVVATERQASRISAALPSTDAIKQSAHDAYKAVASARLWTTKDAVDTLHSNIENSLDADLIVPASAPRTYRALEQLKNETTRGDIAQLMSVRQKLGNIKPMEGTDYAAAAHVRNAIDEFIENLDPKNVAAGDPKFTAETLHGARASWRSYKELEMLERIGEEAEHRSASTGGGPNKINAIRQNIRKILDSETKSRGFSSEAKEQMERIVLGTWATNSTRWASQFAPSGIISTGFGLLAGEAAGPGVGTAVAGGGLIARYLGEYLTKRQLRELEDIIRAESPIGQGAAVEPTSGLVTGSAARGAAGGTMSALSQNHQSPLAQTGP